MTTTVSATTVDFDRTYDSFRRLVGQDGQANVSAATLIAFIMQTISFVEKVTTDTGDKGAAKKQLALRLLQRLIGELPLSESDRDAVLQVLDVVGPSVIDGLVDADHGLLFERGKSAWKRLTGCCRK